MIFFNVSRFFIASSLASSLSLYSWRLFCLTQVILRKINCLDQLIALIVIDLLSLLLLSYPLCDDLLLLLLLGDLRAHLSYALPDLLHLELMLCALGGDIVLKLFFLELSLLKLALLVLYKFVVLVCLVVFRLDLFEDLT